jgi:diguanylate cyclase (GGDEF)-like protein
MTLSVPIRYRYDYGNSQRHENYRRFKIISVVIAAIASLYLLQYQLSPGIEAQTPYFAYYQSIFLSLGIISLVFRSFLPLAHAKEAARVEDSLYFAYTAFLLICCVCLTLLDLSVSNDYTAYAVGVIGLAFFLRASIAKYVVLLLIALAFVTLNLIFTLDITNPFSLFLPLVVISVLGFFIALTSENSRRKVFLLQFQLKEKNEELKKISFKDPLTNLYNRRYLMESLANQIAYFRRTRIPFSVMLIDIDHFKKVNDRLGHQAGDKALLEVAALLKGNSRDSDIVARFGGEEFIVISINTPKEGAFICAERIRSATARHRFSEIPWAVTLSIGISEARADDDEDSLIERTDKNLYRAKSSGRNRCVV